MDFLEFLRVRNKVARAYFNYLVAVFKDSFTYDLLKNVLFIDLSEILGKHIVI